MQGLGRAFLALIPLAGAFHILFGYIRAGVFVPICRTIVLFGGLAGIPSHSRLKEPVHRTERGMEVLCAPRTKLKGNQLAWRLGPVLAQECF